EIVRLRDDRRQPIREHVAMRTPVETAEHHNRRIHAAPAELHALLDERYTKTEDLVLQRTGARHGPMAVRVRLHDRQDADFLADPAADQIGVLANRGQVDSRHGRADVRANIKNGIDGASILDSRGDESEGARVLHPLERMSQPRTASAAWL